MANFTVKFEPTKIPSVDQFVFRTDRGFIKGEAGPSEQIADMFGKEHNPARWKFLISLNAPTAWMDQIKVNKEFRRQGFGTELMGEGLKILRESGIRYVVLSPQPPNIDDYDALNRFYKKFGFVEIRDFQGEPLWNRLMILDFASVP